MNLENILFQKKSTIESKQQSQSHQRYSFNINQISANLKQMSITINPSIVDILYQETIKLFNKRRCNGLSGYSIPDEYIKNRFANEIKNNMEHFMLKNHIVRSVIDEIIKQKVIISGYPRLSKTLYDGNNNTMSFNYIKLICILYKFYNFLKIG